MRILQVEKAQMMKALKVGLAGPGTSIAVPVVGAEAGAGPVRASSAVTCSSNLLYPGSAGRPRLAQRALR